MYSSIRITSLNLIILGLVTALATAGPMAVGVGSHSAVIYFNESCPTCLEYVERVERAFRAVGIVEIRKWDYHDNATAYMALSAVRERMSVPGEFFLSVTTVVDGKYVFEGYFPVEVMTSFIVSGSGLDRLVVAQGWKQDTYLLRKDEQTIECSSSQSIPDCLSSDMLLGSVWTPLVLVSGFVNGLNPCALLVFVYFIGLVSVDGSRGKILRLGMFYVLAVYFMHLALGMGLMQTVLLSGYSALVSKGFGIFVLALAVVGFLHVLRRDPVFPLRVDKGMISQMGRMFSASWLRRSAVGAALLFGAITSILEFPCTSAIYLAIIGMLSVRRMDWMPYFLGYNLMFIMPIMILIVLSSSIAGSKSLRDAVEKRKYLSRAISSLLLLILGVLLLIR